MSKRDKIQYTCQTCGYIALRWLGKCPECNSWNSLVEERPIVEQSGGKRHKGATGGAPVQLKDVDFHEEARIGFRSGELNLVLGGGLVPGSLVLIGGDPGVGKSTLLLQEAAHLANDDFTVLYVTGEESNRQVKLRAERLDLDGDALFLLAETNLDAIMAAVKKVKPNLMIVDSIQTVYQPAFESAPGSISQVRECALSFLACAKEQNFPIVLVGHITKEGSLAGPKVLEHMVDTLLQFEGDQNQYFRILRSVKNRFGSTREIGIFEMDERGLHDVKNPSEIFLSQRTVSASGSAVICTLEGTRPILVEVQALATTTNYGTPQRTATGFDGKKLSLLLAVLEKRIGLRLGAFDVFLNVVGGVRLDEPAADFGVAAAIASSMQNMPLPDDSVLIGEIGLTGEIRYVPQLDKRINEAAKLGFSRAFVPPMSGKAVPTPKNFELVECNRLDKALDLLI